MAQVNDLIVLNDAKFMGPVSIPPDITILNKSLLSTDGSISINTIPENYKYITFKLYWTGLLVYIIKMPIFDWNATNSNSAIMFSQTNTTNSIYQLIFYRNGNNSIYSRIGGRLASVGNFHLTAIVSMI